MEERMPADAVLMTALAAELYPAEPRAVTRRRRLYGLMKRRGVRSHGPFLDDRGFPVRWFTPEEAESLRMPGRRGRPPKE